MNAQQPVINGRLVDAITDVPLPLVKIAVEGSFVQTFSNSEGFFSLELPTIDNTDLILVFSRNGFITKRFPVKFSNVDRELNDISLQPDPFLEREQINSISLSDSDILSDEGDFDNISGILQATRDVYLNAAAFDFSQTFFRVRGLGSEYGKLLINGIEMNKAFDGRPQWSDWGGLNDVQRNQVFTNGLLPNDYAFGGLAGTTNFIMRASKYQKGSRFSFSSSNRSYTGRATATYASGEEKNGWFYAFSIGRRYAKEGYVDGTVYDANSFFLSLEKNISKVHSINFSGIYTPNTRGKSAPLTDEVFELKGRTYNPYWGFQDGEIRNSRIKEVKEPILILNHFWKISDQIDLNTNLAYQFGEISNSRIDYGGTTSINLNEQESFLGGGANPDPVYYQKLPSYFFRFESNQNFEAAYRAEKDIQENGQLDWKQLYVANQAIAGENNNAIYALAEDVNRDKTLTANSILNWSFNDKLKLNSTISFTNLKSQNFGRIADLFGAKGFLDIDVFAEEDLDNPLRQAAQSDLQQVNRVVGEGDRYKYDYDISSVSAEVFSQLQYKFRKLELSLSAKLGTTNYERTGNFQNGLYPDNSIGAGEKVDFFNYGIKSGVIYKFSGRQNLEANLAYFTKAPGFKNAFVNPRQNNEIVEKITEEIINSADLSYRYRSGKFNLRLTGYFSQIDNSTEVSYYYTNGLSGLGREDITAFVQEILTDVDKQYLGIELGGEYQVTSTLKVKAAGSLGQFIYSNNPRLYMTSASFTGVVDYGISYLKNYRLAGGPQRAGQIGVEYRDPDYWWFGASLNYFSHAFIDVNPLTRTANFNTDYDGLPILEYDAEIARNLLSQEQFDHYFLVNMVGGKSWRIKDKYLGFFLSVNNVLDELYKSGGFEQARNSNYRTLKEDRDREMPVFGNKYWYGYGTSFFANVYLRF